jgi:WD40 repeat protein
VGSARGLAFDPLGNRLAVSSFTGLKLLDLRNGAETNLLPPAASEAQEGVAFSPDGGLIAGVSMDRTVRVWDMRTGTELQRFRNASNTAAFTPDGNRLLTGSSEDFVRAWDVRQGQEFRAVGPVAGMQTGLAFSPDGGRLASVGPLAAVMVWNLATGKPLFKHDAGANTARFFPDGLRLAVATGSAALPLPGEVKVLDAATGKILLQLKGHTRAVRGLDVSPDGKRLASSSLVASEVQARCEVKVWDTNTGKALLTIPELQSILDVRFAPDGRALAGACWDGSVKLWDSTTGKELAVLRFHEAPVSRVCFRPDGQALASTDAIGVTNLWELPSGHCRWQRNDKRGSESLEFSSDGRTLATVSMDLLNPTKGEVRLVDAERGREVLTLPGSFALAFSPKNGWLATVSGNPFGDNAIHLWHGAAWPELAVLHPGQGAVTALAAAPGGAGLWAGANGKLYRLNFATGMESGQNSFSVPGLVRKLAVRPDGAQLAVILPDGKVHMQEALSGKELRVLEGHSKPVQSLAYRPDGEELATAAEDGTIRLWNTATFAAGAVIMVAKNPHVSAVAWHPDGRRLASASSDGILRLWKAVGQEWQPHEIARPIGADALRFSPDGSMLAVACSDHTAKLFTVETGRLLHSLTGHSQAVYTVAFSVDGKLLASGGWDMSVRVWEVASGRQVADFRGHGGIIRGLVFDQTAELLASAGWDGSVRIWDLRGIGDGKK